MQLARSTSIGESGAVAAEADDLCRAIESQYVALRQARLGDRPVLAGARLRLLQTDRNTVYRVRGRFRWFLKMPRRGTPDPDRRELRGAEAVRTALEDYSGYRRPAAVRIAVETPYVLSAAVPGRPLHRAVYTACCVPLLGRMRSVCGAFGHLGEALGRLHETPPEDGLPAANKNAAVDLRARLQRVSTPDATTKAILAWTEQCSDDVQSTFIHGNLKMENVLIDGDRVCLLDFENIGRGSPCEDLSWVCSQIALTRTLGVYPWKRGFRLLDALLQGYRRTRQYDRDELLQYVTMRICHYYVAMCLQPSKRPRIAGIAVRRPRLMQMVEALLERRHDAVFTDLEF